MSARLDTYEAEPPRQRPDNHHLASNIIEREAEEGTIAMVETQELASYLGTRHHAAFLGIHGLWRACRATGLDTDGWGVVIPFGEEIVERHFSGEK